MELTALIRFKQAQVEQLQTEIRSHLRQHGANLLRERYGVNPGDTVYVERYGKMLQVRVVNAVAHNASPNSWLTLNAKNIKKDGKVGGDIEINIYQDGKVVKGLE